MNALENKGTIFVWRLYYIGLLTIALGAICALISPIRFTIYKCLGFIYKVSINHSAITYGDSPLSPVSKRRLGMVKRKTLVLDMDETLITTVLDRNDTGMEPLPEIPYDYSFYLEDYDYTFYVYKRPYVDLFLEKVSKWYDVTIYTAASQGYAEPVLDFLDAGRGILRKRLYRQHCIDVMGLRGKYVSLANSDLANVLLVDNSDVECSFNAGNSVRIRSFRVGRQDEALLNLLPFLDALRFTSDVRTVLERCTRYDCLTTAIERSCQDNSF
ncbi:CTD nuclear envelope phosphatase 1 [Scaptodrosophila lebanonensis]|uniref:CTD nuclear envelope phosphatase 1 n=1 Tax=Drosophila lebanonensis TaxID=7225 RepID=A0A6J2TR01_DROLE|nr:CTD nuclear envelope phosphatase 1 [Scaptodrosophila lebanonensis]